MHQFGKFTTDMVARSIADMEADAPAVHDGAGSRVSES